MNLPNCDISDTASISPDARIFPSVLGTKIKIGAHTHIYEFVVIRAVGGAGDIVIGEHCYINPHCTLYSGNGIRMGNYVLIAAGTVIMPTNHAFERRDIEIRKQGFMPSRGGVSIEDDVWIGANCTILDGTYIERGAVLAAGSVAKGRIEAYSIWGGVPAKLIKKRP
jgi:acetyltransferase-like isoleucine patch superfamily enzyme